MTPGVRAGLQHMRTPREVAEAFSSHRFPEVYSDLADDVVWTSRGGGPPLRGRDAVVAACESSGADLASTTVEFRRFVVVADAHVAAVDAVARYTDGDDVSVVSSCDVYEFRAGALAAITSYAVELVPAAAPGG